MKIMEKETPAMAAFYKGCMEGLDLQALNTTNEHCLHVNEVDDLMAFFAMKEILNDRMSTVMGWR